MSLDLLFRASNWDRSCKALRCRLGVLGVPDEMIGMFFLFFFLFWVIPIDHMNIMLHACAAVMLSCMKRRKKKWKKKKMKWNGWVMRGSVYTPTNPLKDERDMK